MEPLIVYFLIMPSLFQDFSLINLESKLKLNGFQDFCSGRHVMGVT